MLRLATVALFVTAGVCAQTFPLDSTGSLEPLHADVKAVEFQGKKGVAVTISKAAAVRVQRTRAGRKKSSKKAGEAGRVDVLAFLKDVEFSNRAIELELAGQPAPGSQGGARGFVG